MNREGSVQNLLCRSANALLSLISVTSQSEDSSHHAITMHSVQTISLANEAIVHSADILLRADNIKLSIHLTTRLNRQLRQVRDTLKERLLRLTQLVNFCYAIIFARNLQFTTKKM